MKGINKTANATIWSLLDTYAGFGLKFIFAIWIIRLLTPHDYGLIAYTGLFLGIANWLSEGGFGTALIQKKNVSNLDFSTGYIFNVAISSFFFFLYFFSASLISNFFNEPELENIFKVSSITLIINSLCYIHQIKLIKNRSFKELSIINFISAIVSGSTGVVLAYLDFHYWALIFQTIIAYLFRMIGLWYIVKWRPMLSFSWGSFKEQFRFGSKLFIQGMVESIFREIHSLIIGKTYQTAALGSYSRGQKFYDLFVVQTGQAINKVLYPTMVLKNENFKLFSITYFRTYSLLFFIMAPISLFLILLSKSIIIVLLTEKWISAAPYMQLYCIAGFVFSLSYLNATTILTSNKPKLYLQVDLFQKLLIGIALLITYNLGISFIIIGWLFAYYIYYIMYEYVMFRQGFYSSLKYYQMFQTAVCLLPSVLFYLISSRYIENPFSLLVINGLIQPLLYIVLNKLLKTEVFFDLISIVKPFFKKN